MWCLEYGLVDDLLELQGAQVPMKPGANLRGIIWSVIISIPFWLCLAALVFSCAGPADSAPGQPTLTAEYYEYLPYVSRATTAAPTPRPTVVPAPTVRPTATN